MRHALRRLPARQVWRCRSQYSPRSCAGSTVCEDRRWRRPERSRPWSGQCRGENHAPRSTSGTRAARIGQRAGVQRLRAPGIRRQTGVPIDQRSTEEQLFGCQPSPPGECRFSSHDFADILVGEQCQRSRSPPPPTPLIRTTAVLSLREALALADATAGCRHDPVRDRGAGPDHRAGRQPAHRQLRRHHRRRQRGDDRCPREEPGAAGAGRQGRT